MRSRKKVTKIFVFIVAVLMISALVGTFAGNAIFFNSKKRPKNQSGANAYAQTFAQMNFQSHETPENRCASDAFIIASHLLGLMDHYSISGIGNVETGYGTIGGLKLWGHAEKNKDKIHTYILAWNQFFSSYRVGLKYDYDLKSELIDFFWGKTKSNGTAEWDSPETITVEDYVDEWGMDPTTFFAYTISNKTALENPFAEKYIKNGKIYYKFSILLDPDKSVINYANQLKKMSNASSQPVFNYIKFDFILDDSFVFQSVSIEEKYWAYVYGFALNCTAKIEYSFSY